MKTYYALKNQPKVLSLEVTTRCNLDCIYCTKKTKGVDDLDLNPELLKQIYKEIDDFVRVIICGIGESFLYPGIYKLIGDCKKQKFCIVTNGTIPIDFPKLNANGNVEILIISIDALEQKLLNQISGRYKFENLLENLESYDKYIKEGGPRIQRVLNCTLNEHNVSEIIKLVEFAHLHRFETIHFSFPRGKELFIKENQNKLSETLKYAAQKSGEYGIYFADPFSTCCVYLKWVTPYVSINGDVFACAETLYIDQKLGNIFDKSLKNIWSSSAYKEFQTGAACCDCKFLSNCKFEF